MIYGYARVSRPTQSIDRQVRNIKADYPAALIIKEAYTGTKVQGRKEFEKLLRTLRKGDIVIFDSVSRMSRNASEGIAVYEDLHTRGVSLIFLKEPAINSDCYDKAVNSIPMTGTAVDPILQGVNIFLKNLRREQIKAAFGQAEKEVEDLHERTREGIETARLNGKQIGRASGTTFETKKAKEAKKLIAKHSRNFGGTLSDVDVMRIANIARNTYYKYKRELLVQV